MRQIIKVLKAIKGKYVNVYTNHKLFGKQHLQMVFEPETEVGFGFHFRDQIIYIEKDDMVSYEINNEHIVINGSMMSIKIVQTS